MLSVLIMIFTSKCVIPQLTFPLLDLTYESPINRPRFTYLQGLVGYRNDTLPFYFSIVVTGAIILVILPGLLSLVLF